MVCLARAEYEEPNTDIIGQSISQRTQIQEFVDTNRLLIPTLSWVTPIAIQNNQISEEDQQAATAHYFGILLVTANNLLGPALGTILGAVTAPPPPIYRQQTCLNIL